MLNLRRIIVNWKTSLGGLAAILAAVKLLMGYLSPAWDDDPETMVNWNMVLESLGVLAAGLAALWARDNDKSSADNAITPGGSGR